VTSSTEGFLQGSGGVSGRTLPAEAGPAAGVAMPLPTPNDAERGAAGGGEDGPPLGALVMRAHRFGPP
jgi:hypothetical protein